MSAEEYAKGRYGGVSNDPSNSSYQLGQAERIAYSSGSYYEPGANSYDPKFATGRGRRVRLPRWFVRVVVIGVVAYFAGSAVWDGWLAGEGAGAVLHAAPALGLAAAAQLHRRLRDAFEYLCLVVFWVWGGLNLLIWSGFSF